MKISLESVFERVMACTHLRAITWLISVSFCIVFWGLLHFLRVKSLGVVIDDV